MQNVENSVVRVRRRGVVAILVKDVETDIKCMLHFCCSWQHVLGQLKTIGGVLMVSSIEHQVGGICVDVSAKMVVRAAVLMSLGVDRLVEIGIGVCFQGPSTGLSQNSASL